MLNVAGRLGLLFFVISLCAAYFGLTGCAQGTTRVQGDVVRVRGNQMPSPDLPDPKYPGYRTRIYFYEPVGPTAAIGAGQVNHYARIDARLVKSVNSNKHGRFSLRLKPGQYSVLIGRDSLFYANIRNGQGILNPVEVPSGKSFDIRLRADWDALY